MQRNQNWVKMMIWNDMQQKEFMFGSIPIKVKVSVDKTFPSNETIMVLLREMFGHPIVEDVAFYVSYTVYKDFMAIMMEILPLNGLKLYDYKNKKYGVAMSLLHMATETLEGIGWTRVAVSSDKRLLSYTYILVG